MQDRVNMSSKPISIYELESDDKRYFSPFCWAARFAIIHNGLIVDTVPWHFQEKDNIKLSNQGKVVCPVMIMLGLRCTFTKLPNEGPGQFALTSDCKLCGRRPHSNSSSVARSTRLLSSSAKQWQISCWHTGRPEGPGKGETADELSHCTGASNRGPE